MQLNEKIVKNKDGSYKVITEVSATEDELRQHLIKIQRLQVDYEKEVTDLTKGMELSEDEKKFLDNLNKIDEFRALELHKSKVGNVEKRLRDLKEAIETVKTQIKNREELFK